MVTRLKQRQEARTDKHVPTPDQQLSFIDVELKYAVNSYLTLHWKVDVTKLFEFLKKIDVNNYLY